MFEGIDLRLGQAVPELDRVLQRADGKASAAIDAQVSVDPGIQKAFLVGLHDNGPAGADIGAGGTAAAVFFSMVKCDHIIHPLCSFEYSDYS